MATDPPPWRALAELVLAIASEQLGTAALKAASSSMSPLFAVLSVSGYVSAIVWFGRSLRVLPMGLAYGLWVALGMASSVLVGVVVFGEAMAWSRYLGLVAIAAGALVLVTAPGADRP